MAACGCQPPASISGKQQHRLRNVCAVQLAVSRGWLQSSALSLTARPFLLPQYYNLPVVSLRAAAWHLMQAGVEGFKVRWHNPACPPNVLPPSAQMQHAPYWLATPTQAICGCLHLLFVSQVDKVTVAPNQKSLGNASHIIPVAEAAEKKSYFYADR